MTQQIPVICVISVFKCIKPHLLKMIFVRLGCLNLKRLDSSFDNTPQYQIKCPLLQKVIYSGVGSISYPQTLDKAGKVCHGQTL